MSREKLFFLFDANNQKSVRANAVLSRRYARYLVPSMKEADVVVVLGGDGFMLRSLKKILYYRQSLKKAGRPEPDFKVYGLNFGHVGALLNPCGRFDLLTRLGQARVVPLAPLKARILKTDETYCRGFAFNELSVKALAHQMCHLFVSFKTPTTWRGAPVLGDGVIVATPAGSTAYYNHAGGTPFPLGSALLGVQSICSATPLREMVPDTVRISIDADHVDRRPVCVVMDNQVVNNVYGCTVKLDRKNAIPVLLNENVRFDVSALISGRARI